MGTSVAVCFLLSAYAKRMPPRGQGWAAEAEENGDLLLLQVAETRQLISAPTRYSNYTKYGRGMPTFKQFAFFRHAARMLPRVAYIGKIDDDTAVNLRLLVPILRLARCLPNTLIGSIQWSGFIPRHAATGVRGDRCGFSWDWLGALREYGQPGPGLPKGLPKEGCASFGSVPPFPYAAGAGYILSSRLNRWIGLSPHVGSWVLDALGATRDESQWQKFEDTSTGYWLTYSPEPVDYVNIGYWHHDLQCTAKDDSLSGGIYRPPANFSILVHNLKRGGFRFAHARMQRHQAYDRDSCVKDNFARHAKLGRSPGTEPRARRQRAHGAAGIPQPRRQTPWKRQRGLGAARRRAAGGTDLSNRSWT